MKYAGMPMGMWVLFASSFQKQLTAYDLSLVVVKAALLRCRTAFFRISEQQLKQPDHQRTNW